MRPRATTAFALLSAPATAILMLGAAMLGCGDSSGKTSAPAATEARFKGLRSLSESNSKEAIAEHKKQALAELKRKQPPSSASAKP